jgi:hypothetical protein
MASIVPSERLRRELAEIVAGVGDEDDPIETIGRLGARLILQQALEEELSEFLGRERYERRGEPVSHRNGYERVIVKTTARPLELERPRVRNASALGFASEIVGKGVARTHALEALVVCSARPARRPSKRRPSNAMGRVQPPRAIANNPSRAAADCGGPVPHRTTPPSLEWAKLRRAL